MCVYIYGSSEKFFEVQVFFFFFLFFFSLINGHDAESQSLQEPPGCESEAPRAVSHAARMPVQKDSSEVRLFPLPSLFKKEVDPIDFSPCIKQETIINV